MKLDYLSKNPFFLKEEEIRWVENLLNSMSLEEKISQLFCLCVVDTTEDGVREIYRAIKPGAVMYRPMSLSEAVSLTQILSKYSEIPLLIAANLEKGSDGIINEGTLLGSQMEVAATDDPDMARKLGLVCGREGAAVGANWAFAPIIDIDYNFRNPITNTRTYGSDPGRVGKMGEAYVKAVQSCGVAACIKHFPGDGCDERDQHLVTSINSLSCEEWDATYGKNYARCIEAGALTCMVGHIMQPAWSKRLNPSLRDDEILPGSLSKELMTDLLRKRLNFNGLICTDATTMAGFTIPLPRKEAVPQTIAAGADMFLFTRNLDEDFEYMADGVRRGIITEERLNEAVARILATKAALGLHKNRSLPSMENAEKIVGCEEHIQWAKECADRSVTLVKEQKGVLPITPRKYPKILYYPIESDQGVGYSVKVNVCDHFKKMLENEGFQVTTFEPKPDKEGKVIRASEILSQYDLIVYAANISTKSNQTTVRIEWQQPMGANCPHYLNSIPTIFISFENPYHLLDVPRIQTFINTYNSNDHVLQAVMEKLTGKSKFMGKSPVDPFCGKWEAHL